MLIMLRRIAALAVFLAFLPATPVFGQTAAQRAVDAAKKYAGTTITIHWQAGLQSLDPKEFSAPLWEKLTGVKMRVVETPLPEMFVKTLQDFRAGTGTLDVLDVTPAWLPDLAQAGALEPLDPYIDRFGYRDELKSIAPVFRDNWMTYGGRTYGFADDGDVLILYYRKDLFADRQLDAEFRARSGCDLAPPATWDQFVEIGAFFTERLKKDGVYGATYSGDPSISHYLFQERFRDAGGRFFDERSITQPSIVPRA